LVIDTAVVRTDDTLALRVPLRQLPDEVTLYVYLGIGMVMDYFYDGPPADASSSRLTKMLLALEDALGSPQEGDLNPSRLHDATMPYEHINDQFVRCCKHMRALLNTLCGQLTGLP
jgi:hypothetical protein